MDKATGGTQHYVSEYFTSENKTDTRNPKKDVNPAKRTRDDLSSMGSDPGESAAALQSTNNKILEQLGEIKDELKRNMKTEDLKGIVQEIVTGMLKGMKVEMKEEMDKKINDVKAKHDKKYGKLKDDYDKLNFDNEEPRKKIQDQKKEIKAIEDTVIKAKRTADQARARANRNEQYSRKTNIKLHGVEEVKLPNGNIEDTQTTVFNVLKESVNVEITPEENVASHRIPGKGAVQPILLKLKNTEIKSRVMKKRKVFRENRSGSRLSDDVTLDNAKLIRTLVEHPDVSEAWYFNCTIFAKLKGHENKIKFDICDGVEGKLRKRLSWRDRRGDPAQGYETDSDSD